MPTYVIYLDDGIPVAINHLTNNDKKSNPVPAFNRFCKKNIFVQLVFISKGH
jgi:hypothetical protein